jgi:hypothetical protein
VQNVSKSSKKVQCFQFSLQEWLLLFLHLVEATNGYNLFEMQRVAVAQVPFAETARVTAIASLTLFILFSGSKQSAHVVYSTLMLSPPTFTTVCSYGYRLIFLWWPHLSLDLLHICVKCLLYLAPHTLPSLDAIAVHRDFQSISPVLGLHCGSIRSLSVFAGHGWEGCQRTPRRTASHVHVSWSTFRFHLPQILENAAIPGWLHVCRRLPASAVWAVAG